MVLEISRQGSRQIACQDQYSRSFVESGRQRGEVFESNTMPQSIQILEVLIHRLPDERSDAAVSRSTGFHRVEGGCPCDRKIVEIALKVAISGESHRLDDPDNGRSINFQALPQRACAKQDEVLRIFQDGPNCLPPLAAEPLNTSLRICVSLPAFSR